MLTGITGNCNKWLPRRLQLYHILRIDIGVWISLNNSQILNEQESKGPISGCSERQLQVHEQKIWKFKWK